MSDIQTIKERLKLEDLIAERYTITGKGRELTTREHDSLKIRVDRQRWYWHSRGLAGDIIDWYMLVNKCDFRTALENLARRAGVELVPLTPERQAALDAERQRDTILRLAADHYHQQLLSNQDALAYCTDERCWTIETIKRERIGYVPPQSLNLSISQSPTDNKDLSVILRDANLLAHPMAKAVLSIPAGMIVYVHQERGRITYLSGRSIEAKRHYNLPEELVGPKPLYHNDVDRRANDALLLVEGQADAISLGQLGIPAIALCGVKGDSVKATHIALDNDKAGQAAALDLALTVDPLARIVTWPKTLRHRLENKGHINIKDANDLLKGDLEADTITTLLDEAPTAIQQLATVAGKAKNDERKALIDRFFAIYCNLDEMVATDIKPDLADRLCGSMGQFNRLLKAHEKSNEDEKPSPDHYEYSAGGARAGLVWEQCISYATDGTGTTFYMVRQPNGEIKSQTSVDVGGVTYLPFRPNLGILRSQRVVLFPECAAEYHNEQQLNQEIQDFIHHYLDIDPFYEKLASYYVMFSWLYDLFENLPYLRALGEYGTGKTRFIQTIGSICYRPMLVSGASTTSPIFNIIDMFAGTLVIDEADFSNSDTDNEIIKILNIGYYKGGVVLRAEKDISSETYIPSARDVFGPKILATRKLFQDRATESRCLTKRMSSARPRPGIPYTLDADFWQRACTLRNKLLMYRLRNHKPIIVDQSLADESVEPRLNQVTLALKTIIKDAKMRSDIDAFIRAYNEVMISDRQLTMPALVVQALVDIYYGKKTDLLDEDTRDLTPQGIAARVKEILADLDPETKVHPRLISGILRDELGIATNRKVRHPINRRVMVVFEESELIALMKRYGVENPRNENSETSKHKTPVLADQ